MNSTIEISESEIIRLMQEAFLHGVSSYADLSETKCIEILNKFFHDKKQKVPQTYTMTSSNNTWTTAYLDNMTSFLSNVFVS